MRSKNPLHVRHSMSEFGTVAGKTAEVRANRLEGRLEPLVPFPHRHAFYHLVVVTGGKGWHEIDFHRHPVRASMLFFMRPGQVHSWQLSARTRGFVIEFGDETVLGGRRGNELAFEVLDRATSTLDLSRVDARLRTRLLFLLNTMLEEYERTPKGFELSLGHYLSSFLLELSRTPLLSTMPVAGPDSTLDRFLRLVEEHYSREHEVAFYAHRLKTTPRALTMRAIRALGKPARTVIHDRCLLEGKRLLAYSNLSVAEIGYELGFADPNYFSRFFRSQTGLTPGRFRVGVRP